MGQNCFRNIIFGFTLRILGIKLFIIFTNLFSQKQSCCVILCHFKFHEQNVISILKLVIIFMNLKFGKINTVLDMTEEFRTLLTPSSTILRNTKKNRQYFYDFFMCSLVRFLCMYYFNQFNFIKSDYFNESFHKNNIIIHIKKFSACSDSMIFACTLIIENCNKWLFPKTSYRIY